MFLFHALNLMLLLYFIYRILKKYFIPSLARQKQEQDLVMSQLHHKCKKLQEQHDQLKEERATQEETYKDLDKKVVLWRATITSQQEAHKMIHHIIHNQINTRRVKQQQELIKEQTYHAIMPDVISKVCNDLNQRMDEGYAQEYIDKILYEITKGT
jgi:hypothetical protein